MVFQLKRSRNDLPELDIKEQVDVIKGGRDTSVADGGEKGGQCRRESPLRMELKAAVGSQMGAVA